MVLSFTHDVVNGIAAAESSPRLERADVSESKVLKQVEI